MPPDGIAEGRLTLRGDEAVRALQRGARAGAELIALDNCGWEISVLVEEARPELCTGRVTGRHLAHEPRTKIALYHSLLHPSDFRRLVSQATAAGVVAIVPVITDGSVVPRFGPDGTMDGWSDWPRLARDAAELHGRGMRPLVAPVTLFDQALDQVRGSSAALLVHPGGISLAEAASHRPFSVDVFCPPPTGFSPAEVAHAAARGIVVVDLPRAGADPIQAALAVVQRILDMTEV